MLLQSAWAACGQTDLAVPTYSFDEFLGQFTLDSATYRAEFDSKLRYPPILRENMVEGDYGFYILYRNGQFEVEKGTDKVYEYFAEHIEWAFNKSEGLKSTDSPEPYRFLLKVQYDVAPYRTRLYYADFVRSVPALKRQSSSNNHPPRPEYVPTKKSFWKQIFGKRN